MAQKQVFIQPRDIYTNVPGNFALGRKSSGVAMLQYPTTGAGIGANTNLVIGFGVPWEIWNGDDNRSMYLKSVKLNHFISAVSAGVTPIISGNVAFYEVVHRVVREDGFVLRRGPQAGDGDAGRRQRLALALSGRRSDVPGARSRVLQLRHGRAGRRTGQPRVHDAVRVNDLVERDVTAADRRHPRRDGRDEVVELDALQVHGTVIVTVPYLPRNAEPDDQVRVCPNTRPSGRVLQHGD